MAYPDWIQTAARDLRDAIERRDAQQLPSLTRMLIGSLQGRGSVAPFPPDDTVVLYLLSLVLSRPDAPAEVMPNRPDARQRADAMASLLQGVIDTRALLDCGHFAMDTGIRQVLADHKAATS